MFTVARMLEELYQKSSIEYERYWLQAVHVCSCSSDATNFSSSNTTIWNNN